MTQKEPKHVRVYYRELRVTSCNTALCWFLFQCLKRLSVKCLVVLGEHKTLFAQTHRQMKRFSNCGTVSCANYISYKCNAEVPDNYSCDTEQFGSNGNAY